MPAVYIIMPRCLLPIRKRVHGSGSRSYCLSCRAVLNHHAAWFCFIMPRGVAILYHAGGSALSFRAVLNHHSAGLIAYQVAGLLSIIPRCYSAGGSALSFRGVLLYHAAGCCYSQSCRRVYIIIQRCYSLSCGRGYSLSCRGVIVYHAGGSALSCRGVLLFSIMPAVYIIMPRVHGSGSRSYCLPCRAVLNHHAARVYIIMPAV